MKAISALRFSALLAGFLPLWFLSALPLGAAMKDASAPPQPEYRQSVPASAPPPTLTMQPEYRQSVLAPGSGKVELLIRVKAMPAPGQERLPLSVALVIDRSGSMDQEDKLSYARIAAANLVGQLDEQDEAALVAYGYRAEELFPTSPMTSANRQQILHLISSLQSGGSTNLYGGMEAGFLQMEQAANLGQQRIILLSDGLPDGGPGRLAALAAQIRQAGISLSTMGLGPDHDENLMRLLAQRGGGNYYYIRKPEETKRYFADELQDIMAGVSKATTLVLNLNDNVLESRVYGYTLERQGQEYTADIRDFHGDEERSLMLELTIRPVQESRVLDLGSLTLRYQSLTGNGVQESVVVPLQVEISPDRARQQASINRQAKAWNRDARRGD
jgi:Ca-activated chloride channel family protein